MDARDHLYMHLEPFIECTALVFVFTLREKEISVGLWTITSRRTVDSLYIESVFERTSASPGQIGDSTYRDVELYNLCGS